MRSFARGLLAKALGDRGALAQFEAELPQTPDSDQDGWLAREYANPEMFDAPTLGPIVASLAQMPREWFVSRLLAPNFVDAALAELLVVAALASRHHGRVSYEQATEQGTCPDLWVTDQPITYEVRLIEEWGPSTDRTRIRGQVYHALSKQKLRANVILKFSDMLTFTDAEVKALVPQIVHSVSNNLPESKLDLTAALPTKKFDGTGKPSITISVAASPSLEVVAERPNIMPLTGRRAAAIAVAENAVARTIASQPSGTTLHDFIRKTVKRKTSQLPNDRSGVVVLVSRVDLEPHVTDWPSVLDAVLREEELLIADPRGPFQARPVRDSVVSPTSNTRLAAVVGLTVDVYGMVARCGGLTNPHVEVPEALKLFCANLSAIKPEQRKTVAEVLTVGELRAWLRVRALSVLGQASWRLRRRAS